MKFAHTASIALLLGVLVYLPCLTSAYGWSQFTEEDYCKRECGDLPTGDYQICGDCTVYATCVPVPGYDPERYFNRSCPAFDANSTEEWDDIKKRCVPPGYSDTCGEGMYRTTMEPPTTEEPTTLPPRLPYCGVPTFTNETETVIDILVFDGTECTGSFVVGECAGYCSSRSQYNYFAVDQINSVSSAEDDPECCRPVCFENANTTLSCGEGNDVDYHYMVPTECSCTPFSVKAGVSGPNILYATCDDEIRVYFDDVKQQPRGNRNDHEFRQNRVQKVSYYLLDRCSLPDEIKIECEVANEVAVGADVIGILAADSDGNVITNRDWICTSDDNAVPQTATELRKAGTILRGRQRTTQGSTLSDAYWIWDARVGLDVTVTCSLTL